jgi:hypothetical protein
VPGSLFGRMDLSPLNIIAGWNNVEVCGIEGEECRGLVFDIGGVSLSEVGTLRQVLVYAYALGPRFTHSTLCAVIGIIVADCTS